MELEPGRAEQEARPCAQTDMTQSPVCNLKAAKTQGIA